MGWQTVVVHWFEYSGGIILAGALALGFLAGIALGGFWLFCRLPRGWGYLTGKGHGALGLDAATALKIQNANLTLFAFSRTDLSELATIAEQAIARAEKAEADLTETRRMLAEADARTVPKPVRIESEFGKIAARRFGPDFSKPCRNPIVVECFVWECQFKNECQYQRHKARTGGVS